MKSFNVEARIEFPSGSSVIFCNSSFHEVFSIRREVASMAPELTAKRGSEWLDAPFLTFLLGMVTADFLGIHFPLKLVDFVAGAEFHTLVAARGGRIGAARKPHLALRSPENDHRIECLGVLSARQEGHPGRLAAGGAGLRFLVPLAPEFVKVLAATPEVVNDHDSSFVAMPNPVPQSSIINQCAV